MIVLDTNVLSEVMRPTPVADVLAWLADQPATNVYVTTVTVAEILFGIHVLPASRRRRDLETAAEQIFAQFAGRILPFDGDAARAYAKLMAERRQAGRPLSHFDAQIAGIVHSRGATLATRNVADFEGTGIDLLNPWKV